MYSIKIAFAIASFGAAPLGISTFFSPFFPLLFSSLTRNFLYFPACNLPLKGRCNTLAYKLSNLYSYTLYEYHRRVPPAIWSFVSEILESKFTSFCNRSIIATTICSSRRVLTFTMANARNYATTFRQQLKRTTVEAVKAPAKAPKPTLSTEILLFNNRHPLDPSHPRTTGSVPFFRMRHRVSIVLSTSTFLRISYKIAVADSKFQIHNWISLCFYRWTQTSNTRQIWP